MPIYSLFYLLALTLITGLSLGIAAAFLRVKKDPTIDRIDAILPQNSVRTVRIPWLSSLC